MGFLLVTATISLWPGSLWSGTTILERDQKWENRFHPVRREWFDKWDFIFRFGTRYRSIALDLRSTRRSPFETYMNVMNRVLELSSESRNSGVVRNYRSRSTARYIPDARARRKPETNRDTTEFVAGWKKSDKTDPHRDLRFLRKNRFRN